MMQKCFGYRQPEKRAMLHRSEEHTSELQSPCNLVCRLLLEKKKLLAISGLGLVPVAILCYFSVSHPTRRPEHDGAHRQGQFRRQGDPTKRALFFFFRYRAPPDLSPFPRPGPLPI